MKSLKFYLLFTFAILFISTSVSAQPIGGMGTGFIPSGFYFFSALIGGLILAIAFQLILTHLSLAAGLSALKVDNLKKASEHSSSGSSNPHPDASISQHAGSAVRKIVSTFGIYTLVTTCISIFFAVWLAVEISAVASITAAVTLGLLIWGLFYILATMLETSMLSSLCGSLSRMAMSSLSNVRDSVTSVMSKSEDKKMEEAAHRVAGAVKDEIFGDINTKRLRKDLERYIDRLNTEPREVRKEMEQLFKNTLQNTELKAVTAPTGPFSDKEKIAATLEKEHKIDKDQAKTMAESMKSTADKFRDEAKNEKPASETSIDAALRASGMNEHEARAYREKVENYLRSTNKEELNPDSIKRDIEQMLHDPRGGLESLQAKLALFDRETMAALLAQREDMSEAEAREKIDQIEHLTREYYSKLPDIQAVVSKMLTSAKESAHGKKEEMKANAKSKFAGVENDTRQIFYDEESEPDSLIRRLKSMNRDSLIAIVSTRRDISEEEAEEIVSRMERSRDDVINRANKMKEEMKVRMKKVQEEAVIAAEETRKTAATTAWWTFTTALLSAVVAVFAGIVAIFTGIPI